MDDKQLADGSFRFVDVKSHADGRIQVDYRLMSPGLFVGKVEFHFTHVNTAGPKPKTLSKLSVEPARIHDDPFVWRENRLFRGGAGTLTVLITVDGRPKLEDKIDLGSPLSAAQAEVRRDPPRLVLDINDTPRSSPAIGGVSEPRKVLAVLNRIAQLLARGLDDTAWLGPTSGRGLSLQEMELPQSARQEEAWARRVSEMMLLAPYFLSGTVYRTANGADDPMYDAMAKRLDAGAESFYPVAVECQQLCTVILMSRGVPRNLLGSGINAGDSEGLPVFRASNQGATNFDSAVRKAPSAVAASPPVGPGTLYQFSKPGQPNKGAAHIGTILRVQKGPWAALQPFDTGGLNSPKRGEHVRLMSVQGGLGGGIFDDPWVTNIVGTSERFSGAMIIGTQHKPPANLARWWPCGFARLMIRRRADNALLYASPLLRMHDATRDFPYSVLANSLRGVPVVEELEPIWQISAPRSTLAALVMAQPRGATAGALLSTTNVPPERHLSNNFAHLFLLVNITARSDGSILKQDLPKNEQQATPADTLPWGVRSGSLAAAIPLGEVPRYLRGDE